MEQLNELRRWLSVNSKSTAVKKLKPNKKQGYWVLFDGPSALDKFKNVEMLAREFDKEVYRINLSSVVSKYIGETEKNLAAIVKKAEDKDVILYFDEADALLGKRTDVKDSHDKYANIDVSYLIQQMENYPGIVIVAVNKKENIDAAFIRRFQSVVQFPATNNK